jgi:hypothetical protein
MDTPRRATTSVTPGINNAVDLVLKLISNESTGREVFSYLLDFCSWMVGVDHFLDVAEKQTGVRFDIIDKPKHLSFQRFKPGSQCQL